MNVSCFFYLFLVGHAQSICQSKQNEEKNKNTNAHHMCSQCSIIALPNEATQNGERKIVVAYKGINIILNTHTHILEVCFRSYRIISYGINMTIRHLLQANLFVSHRKWRYGKHTHIQKKNKHTFIIHHSTAIIYVCRLVFERGILDVTKKKRKEVFSKDSFVS